MTERIDHAAVALRIIDEVSTDEQGVIALELLDTVEQWVYATSMREAQVHATLALVEQQRIANIIELSRPRRMPNGGEASYMLYDPETFKLRDDVREGLGL